MIKLPIYTACSFLFVLKSTDSTFPSKLPKLHGIYCSHCNQVGNEQHSMFPSIQTSCKSLRGFMQHLEVIQPRLLHWHGQLFIHESATSTSLIALHSPALITPVFRYLSQLKVVHCTSTHFSGNAFQIRAAHSAKNTFSSQLNIFYSQIRQIMGQGEGYTQSSITPDNLECPHSWLEVICLTKCIMASITANRPSFCSKHKLLGHAASVERIDRRCLWSGPFFLVSPSSCCCLLDLDKLVFLLSEQFIRVRSSFMKGIAGTLVFRSFSRNNAGTDECFSHCPLFSTFI